MVNLWSFYMYGSYTKYTDFKPMLEWSLIRVQIFSESDAAQMALL